MQVADAIIGSVGIAMGIPLAVKVALAAKQNPKPVPVSTKVFVGSILTFALMCSVAVMQELAIRLFELSPVINFQGTVPQIVAGACIFLGAAAYVPVFFGGDEESPSLDGEEAKSEQER